MRPEIPSSKYLDMQIYGIDLASEKFDVSFVDEDGRPRHMVVKNAITQIERFLDNLPADAHIVAEHTGVYGDLLLYLADIRGIAVSYVQAYAIKHSMGLVRGKSDPLDCARIREYGERYADRLILTHFPSESLYMLKELHSTRRLLVDMRKLALAGLHGDQKRPLHSNVAERAKAAAIEELTARIDEVEKEMFRIIDQDPALKKTSEIVRSIPGLGPVTTTELIIKTDNFTRVATAKKCATLAGISPWPNSTGKSDRGCHVSHMGDTELKSLLYMCARSASVYFEKMRIYKMKKLDVEKKHFFVVMNNIANRLLKIIYALVKKGEMFDPNFVTIDPRLEACN